MEGLLKYELMDYWNCITQIFIYTLCEHAYHLRMAMYQPPEPHTVSDNPSLYIQKYFSGDLVVVE